MPGYFVTYSTDIDAECKAMQKDKEWKYGSSSLKLHTREAGVKTIGFYWVIILFFKVKVAGKFNLSILLLT